jgi:hypothetical protein
VEGVLGQVEVADNADEGGQQPTAIGGVGVDDRPLCDADAVG